MHLEKDTFYSKDLSLKLGRDALSNLCRLLEWVLDNPTMTGLRKVGLIDLALGKTVRNSTEAVQNKMS